MFRTLTKSEASLSNNGARYVFNVLLRMASFARAIRISTLPTRLSSLASGVSMSDMVVIKFVAFFHGNVSPSELSIWRRLMLLARLLYLTYELTKVVV